MMFRFAKLYFGVLSKFRTDSSYMAGAATFYPTSTIVCDSPTISTPTLSM